MTMKATVHSNEGGSLIVTTTGPDAAAACALLDRIEKTAKTVRTLARLTELAAQRHLANLSTGEMSFPDTPRDLGVKNASLVAYQDVADLVGLGDVAKKIVAAVTAGNLVHVQADHGAHLADRDRIGRALAMYVERAGWIKPFDEEKAEYERLATTYAPKEN